MNGASGNNRSGERRIGRSIGAVVAGIAVGIVLTLATDLALHAAGVFPPLGQPTTDGPLVLATIYRTLYGIVGAYVIALLAPYRPMQHALVAGFLGLVVSTIGAAATWNRGLGPHWYPLALIVLAVPPAWVGAKLRFMLNRE